MHEYSIVMSLMEQIEQLAKDNQATSIVRVDIKVGVLSGVEPDLLQRAFDTFKLETICKSALLNIKLQPLIIKCRQCDKETTLEQRNVICPLCMSHNTQVVEGEEMMLMQLEMNT
ncbi:hydrogenase maturation nickel metallochaperone HypA [Shewanella sp. 10N.286.51.B7]|uniref:hydrogenase maturation nickel metallochaperone HypA n=1 Tax=unclassified Shewanella TaxID=196818 RepID=UPI000C857E7D|nr:MULTISPECIES: hydrogenase maturation nickel metallochaperone HypA [unclassified Shewanella]MCC4831766.1 hydrogenase maturation nickel metallochaperone HypA [Shewanella sp. 10N.7]PMG78099.1 hydrogenase maturation nickel metallochaperone HypA [Shewanella sp. 10N.286.51.B7]